LHEVEKVDFEKLDVEGLRFESVADDAPKLWLPS
jgi:hypothetical protein